MGVSASGVLLVGVPADLVVQRKEIKEGYTKYSEETGIPYEAFSTIYEVYVFGKQIDDDDWEDNVLEAYGLQCFRSGDNLKYVGQAIREVSHHELSTSPIHMDEIYASIDAVKVILKRFGIDAEPQLRLEMFYN